MPLQCTQQDVALDLVEVLREVVGQRRGLRRRGRRLGGQDRRIDARVLGDEVELLRRAVGEHRLGQAQVEDIDRLVARQRDGTMQQVLQLAHVARERIAHQVHQRVAREARRRRHVGVARDALEHAFADLLQVLEPLAQRRHADLDDVEPVVQVLPELAGQHLGAEVLVGRTQQPHVDRLLADGAHRPHRALLDRAQQLGLHRQRQVADLVEEQRAAVGRLEEAFAVFGRTREGALAVAEELRFQQLLRDRTAVDGDEGLRAARTHFVDRACDQFLAGAGLAVDEHRRHAARDLFDQRAHLLHRGRGAGHARQRDADRCRGRRQRTRHTRRRGHRRRTRTSAELRRQARRHHGRHGRRCTAQRRRDDRAELLQVDRLGEVVVSAGLQRLDGVLGRTVGGDDDGLLAPAALFEPPQQVEPGAVGQAHVGDDGTVGAVFQMQPGFFDRTRRLDVVALAQQCQLVQRAQVRFVVDDQQAEVGRRGHSFALAQVRSGSSASGSALRRITTLNSLRVGSPGVRRR